MQKLLIETTENPKVIKFVADRMLIEGNLEFDHHSDTSQIPLVEDLLKIPFIDKVFITANFIAVAKNDDSVEWDKVSDQLKMIMEDQLLAYPKLYLPKKKEMFQIYAEMTPNPAVMKFVANRVLLDGFLEAKNRDEAQQIPLATALFDFDYVQEVFLNENYVSVTKTENVEWHQVMIEVRSFIVEYLQNGGKVSLIDGNKKENKIQDLQNREYTDIEEKINALLNEYVSPAVESDGGRISLISFEEDTKTAKMLLQGACSGCPSSTMTLKNGIEGLLKQFMPDVVDHVVAVNG